MPNQINSLLSAQTVFAEAVTNLRNSAVGLASNTQLLPDGRGVDDALSKISEFLMSPAVLPDGTPVIMNDKLALARFLSLNTLDFTEEVLKKTGCEIDVTTDSQRAISKLNVRSPSVYDLSGLPALNGLTTANMNAV